MSDSRLPVAAMKEIAIFDLDGTLIDLMIDREDFEQCRTFWASYLTARGVPTTLKPILPELEKVSRTTIGSTVRAEILKGLDELELAGAYRSLGRNDSVLGAVKSKFRKLVLVTHNGAAFYRRLARENRWPHLFDVIITRDDMIYFKPDARACQGVLKDLEMSPYSSECWVVGNNNVDRDLSINLRRMYAHLVVRTFMIDPGCPPKTNATHELDVDISSVDALLRMPILYG